MNTTLLNSFAAHTEGTINHTVKEKAEQSRPGFCLGLTLRSDAAAQGTFPYQELDILTRVRPISILHFFPLRD